MRLVDNWKDAWKWISIWCFASIGTIEGTVAQFITADQLAAPVLFWPFLEHGWTYLQLKTSVVALLALIGVFGRLVSQSKPEPPPQPGAV